MKNIILLFLLSSLISCDVIEDPIIISCSNFTGDSIPEFVIAEGDLISQKILLEDFTGHKCTNCPEAAEKAVELQNLHPQSVSVLAIHAGNFAETNDDYPIDWTTEIGNILWNQLSFQFNPAGRVNRKATDGDVYLVSQWTDQVNNELVIEPTAVLQSSVYTVGTNNDSLNVHINIQGIENISNGTRLMIFISESHLIGDQLDGITHITDYEFDHVLRGVVGCNSGTFVSNSMNASYNNTFNYTHAWNNEWIMENSSIVAILLDNETGSVINLVEQHL